MTAYLVLEFLFESAVVAGVIAAPVVLVVRLLRRRVR